MKYEKKNVMKISRSIIKALRIVICFGTLYLTSLPERLSAQTHYQINGETIYKTGEKYYALKNSDTSYIDTKHLTIKFKETKELNGTQSIIAGNGGTLSIKDQSGYCTYYFDNTSNFINTVNSINENPNVEKTILGHIWRSNSVPNDPSYVLNILGEYGDYVSNMQMPEAWDQTTGSLGIKIGIIDSGCDWDIQDLPANNPESINFLHNPPSNNTYPNFVTNNGAPILDHHGTKMVSTICAKTNNASYISGVAGGWNGQGGINQILYVTGENGDIDPALVRSAILDACTKGVRILNMSFGGYFEDESIEEAINTAYTSYGMTIIASAGSHESVQNNAVWYPAKYDHVIAVGGTQMTQNQLFAEPDRYYYNEQIWWKNNRGSNFGEGLDVTANAYNAVSLSGRTTINVPNTNLNIESGTSFSSAIVTGVAGLVLSINPCLTVDEVEYILKQSCEKLGGYTYTNGWSEQLGYGRVNAKTAVELAMGEPGKTLTFNETWDHNRSFRGDIIVPNGKTLTLQNMTLKMWENAGITVNKGGTLNIINSTITATCMGMWKGITVEGDNALTQYYNSNQGYLSMQNSTIIHAKNGITTSTGGGIIQATNSHFINNTKSLNIGQYSQPNYRTSFSVCDFIVTNEHRDWVNFQHIAHINMNSGAKFYGCTFSNNNTLHPNVGNGIYSTGANYTVKSSCTNPLISPCPEANLIKSQFSNLEYGTKGYYTSNKILIDLAEFNNNICGIYLSNCSFADILNCKFTVPEFYAPSGKVPYGAYLNYCSAYHVEKNDYIGVNANTTGNIGLYIYNSGGAQNYVYNNKFNNLSRATVADGANRVTGGATGLCYKCNDFTSNGTDIDIVRANNTALLSTHGIALNQGLPSAGSNSTNKDTLAASNTFSSTQYVWNIHNNNNVSNYFSQQYKYPSYAKIFPDPVFNINRYVNSNTSYNKALVCKTWITAGGIISSQLLVEKDAASANAEAVSQQLQNMVDGGSTSNLTFDIIGSIPPEALDLRDELLQKSPYLSDTVLKTTVQQENVLPNAMVRDILVANPQAAKSEDIMAKLDERWEPMPDYMKEEIETGSTVIGGREQLEARREGWKQQESFLFNRIIGNYLSDTVNPNTITELKTYLQNENTAQAGFILVDLNLHQNDYVGAMQAISTMQANLSLTAYESQQAIDYLTLAGILQGLQADTIAFNALDSTNAIPMFTLYNSGENKATAIARDILISAGLLDYQEPINGGDYSKSGSIEMQTTKPGSSTKHPTDQLSIFPNPADTYSILEYVLPANISGADIRICTQSGIQVWQQDIKRVRDQIIVDLTGFSTGSYLVTLNTEMKTISSKSLIISR